jgi:hypothetical protein
LGEDSKKLHQEEGAMGLFGTILEKLGMKRAEAAPVSRPTIAPQSAHAPSVSATPPPPAAIPVVDVMAKLDRMAYSNPQDLNWKTSIVDLLKLLGIDSSFSARKALAIELGCPAEKMGDSAQMNIWLHKEVLRKIAENGGNIPKDLLD